MSGERDGHARSIGEIADRLEEHSRRVRANLAASLGKTVEEVFGPEAEEEFTITFKNPRARRERIFWFSAELIEQSMRTGKLISACFVHHGLPADARLLRVELHFGGRSVEPPHEDRGDYVGKVGLVFESTEWPELGEGVAGEGELRFGPVLFFDGPF